MFVGRKPEREVLSALLRRSRDESVGTALLRGSGGVGKTALIEDWLADIPEGTLVLRGASDAFDKGFPYSAIDRALTELLRLPRAGEEALSQPARTAVERARRVLRGSGASERSAPHLVTQALLEALSAITTRRWSSYSRTPTSPIPTRSESAHCSPGTPALGSCSSSARDRAIPVQPCWRTTCNVSACGAGPR